MAREVAKKGLKMDVESATWINLFRKSKILYYARWGSPLYTQSRDSGPYTNPFCRQRS